MIKITRKMIKDAKTQRGGYNARQIRIARQITGSPKKCISRLEHMEVPQSAWDRFVAEGAKSRSKAKEKPKERRAGAAIATRAQKERKTITDTDFYLSRRWKELRVKVLEKYFCKCMMCGRSPRDHGVVLHVDHVKPRSLFPALELDISNLQILCDECNIGKGNKYQTDWRPDAGEEEILLAAMERI